MAHAPRNQPDKEPAILLVPGLGNSGPDHWQSHWERSDRTIGRVDFGNWDNPHRNTWVNKLNLAIYQVGRPVILVAHSLGCLVTAWWARYEQPSYGSPVAGALLVAPPEVDFYQQDDRLTLFAPTPQDLLPFPSIMVASRNDPFMGIHAATRLARIWGSELIDLGHAGHIDAESGMGRWEAGRGLLARLIGGDERGAGDGGQTLYQSTSPLLRMSG